MKIGAIIQARTASTRLPKKILKKLPYKSNITVLEQVIRRLKKSHKINDIILATTINKSDEAIIKIADKEGLTWFRGSEENVLERFYLTAKKNHLDIIVRITSDCPCLDSAIVDLVIDEYFKQKVDYISNSVNSFSRGQDVEVMSFQTLEKAFRYAKNQYEQEHVTAYIYKSEPNKFKISELEAPPKLFAPDIRLTLDTKEDYVLLCAVFDYLYEINNFFDARSIIQLFQQKSWLKLINKKIIQKQIFDSLEDEIKEAVKILDLQDLKRAKQFLEHHFKELL